MFENLMGRLTDLFFRGSPHFRSSVHITDNFTALILHEKYLEFVKLHTVMEMYRKSPYPISSYQFSSNHSNRYCLPKSQLPFVVAMQNNLLLNNKLM